MTSSHSTRQRPLFADIRMRRAVQYALDRRALAAAAGGAPATHFCRRACRGTSRSRCTPFTRDLRTARRLAAGGDAPVVVYTWDDPQLDQVFNTALGEQLGTIGLRLRVIPIDQSKGFEEAKAARADLIWGGLNANTADPAAYLNDLILPPNDAKELRRIRRSSHSSGNTPRLHSHENSIERRCSPCTGATRSRSCARSGSAA